MLAKYGKMQVPTKLSDEVEEQKKKKKENQERKIK